MSLRGPLTLSLEFPPGLQKGWWIPSRASQQWSYVAAALVSFSLSSDCLGEQKHLGLHLPKIRAVGKTHLSPGSSFPTCDPSGISRAPQQAGSKEGICSMPSIGYPVGLVCSPGHQ